MISRNAWLGLQSVLCLFAGHLFAAERPNILIAISDDQSYPHASAYGFSALETPGFDRVARSGVLFHQAFSASPGCSPSRAAFLTGRYPWQIEQAGTHASSFPSKYLCFPDLLEQVGYHVGFTGKGWGPGNYQVSGRSRNPAGPAYNAIAMNEAPSGIRKTDYAGNFDRFLEERQTNQPFCFWYGASEPHRVFQNGIGKQSGKQASSIVPPAFLPDDDTIRSDLLDYCFEIEWFDRHLVRMLDRLAELGELDNTLVLVTSDNGMAFPRAKANVYEYGIHLPLAIAWPDRIPAGRDSLQLVSVVDFAPTLLEAAQVEFPEAPAMIGKSLMPLLSGALESSPGSFRSFVFSGRERHSSSRYRNWTYPQRAIRSNDYLLIWNLKPDRWPAGAPQKYAAPGELGPMHGGYHDIDACPSLTFLIDHRDDPVIGKYFSLAVGKRPEWELYHVASDPGCIVNLAGNFGIHEVELRLRETLTESLKNQGDTRMSDQSDIWDEYIRYSPLRDFPPPSEPL